MNNTPVSSHKVASMRLSSCDNTGLHLKPENKVILGKTCDFAVNLSGGAEGEIHADVFFERTLLAQLINTESCSDMPAATLGSSQHPSNEECGIRDVWAHNLEDEFRTIRQVIVLFCLIVLR